MKNEEKARLVVEEVKKAVVGKDNCVENVLLAILAGGHILIEDIPGVGKTTLALAFARAMQLKQNRIQFTPDVLPADITGFMMYRKEKDVFIYQQGQAMCNILLADEINRTSPKTQSALLEVMEEGNVTVDGVTREVPKPFIVMATQNPIGAAGTQMLPESQLDRFMICQHMGYPTMQEEIEIVRSRRTSNPIEQIEPVVSREELIEMQREVARIFIHDEVYAYLVRLVAQTRECDDLELGMSPRGSIALSAMAQARAWYHGRKFVIPEDVASVFIPVAVHRVECNGGARQNHRMETEILSEILETVPMPAPEKG